MLIFVVILAIVLYGVLYFYSEFLTQNHGVGDDYLSLLKQIIFHVPQDVFLTIFRIVIALTVAYLVLEVIVNAMRPKTQTKRRRKSLWRWS